MGSQKLLNILFSAVYGPHVANEKWAVILGNKKSNTIENMVVNINANFTNLLFRNYYLI